MPISHIILSKMRLNAIGFLLFILIPSIHAHAQKKGIDNIGELRKLISSGVKYTDSALATKQVEAIIIAITLDSGRVSDVHLWAREDSRVVADIKAVFPLIKQQWQTKDKWLKNVYIPVVTLFYVEDKEPINNKGSEILNILKLLEYKNRSYAYFDRTLIIDNFIGRRSD
jgi:hypothetical protein